MDLDSITCMRKIQYPIQVAIGLNLIIQMDLNLNLVLGFAL
jgi:hypothetical protein